MHTFEITQYNHQLVVHKFMIREVDPQWSQSTHYHKLFELLYCVDGDVEEIVNGQSITFRTGDWLLLKSGFRHETINVSNKPFTFFVFHFDIDDPQLRRQLQSPETAAYLPRSLAEDSKLVTYVKSLNEMFRRNLVSAIPSEEGLDLLDLSVQDKLAFHAYILLIIYEFIETQKQLANSPSFELRQTEISQADLQLAHEIARLLDSSIYKAQQIADIAKLVRTSRTQCTKIFTKVYGISPREYLSMLKLREAKNLLLNSDDSVEKISELLGFSSVHHFSRQFRRWTGMPPSGFRPKHLNFTTSRKPSARR